MSGKVRSKVKIVTYIVTVALSATVRGLITAANSNFAKRLSKG